MPGNGRLDTKVLTIQIQYCGGWGYGPYSRSLRQYLQREFKNLIDFIEKKDGGITGNFEVTIVDMNGTSTLIHSARTRGQGRATTARARQGIVDRIRDALESV